MNQARDILMRARELLSPKENWTQHAPARNHNGTATDPTSEFACAWCAMGAIHRAQSDGKHPTRAAAQAHRTVTTLVNHDSPYLSIAGWNDHHDRTHDEVLRLFDHAIIATREES